MEGVRAVHTVLAVDDDTILLASYQRAFQRERKRVLVATTSKAARQLAIQGEPDLAIVDLRLGNEWGVDLIEALRSDRPALTIAVVSGYLGVSSTVAAMRAGASHVFFKPITCREILDLVEKGVALARRAEDSESLARQQWEHIMRVLADSKGNVSEAARRLGIHRQALQQRLKKPPA